nr:hypothetical protein [Tanacetum cinerariifolium]
MNGDALARLMIAEMTSQEQEEGLTFIEIKRREVECREREVAAHKYRARQEDIRLYLQPYDHLTGSSGWQWMKQGRHLRRKNAATRQGMNSVEIDQVMVRRVTDAIDAIAIYEAKICMTHDQMNNVIRQETTVEKNANNKRKFENQPKDNCMQQQPTFKKPDVARAYTMEPMKRRLMLGIYLTATS